MFRLPSPRTTWVVRLFDRVSFTIDYNPEAVGLWKIGLFVPDLGVKVQFCFL